MQIEHGLIDVHHHFIPPAFLKAAADRGIDKVAGRELPDWTSEDSIAVMNQNGIQTAILSLSAPGTHLGGGKAQAVSLARACNEYAQQIREKHPGRFGSFAVLPMPFVEASCAEAQFALDHLNADGIVLLGSTDDKYLGDDHFRELMAELNARSAVVFIHPNVHSTSSALGLDIPEFFVEFLCDTTRAAANLILSGTVDQFPNIKWILSHSGGFLPYIAWRMSLANLFPELAEKAPEGIMSYIKRFYYDTALSPSPYSLPALKQLVDPSQILFGSDFPFAPAPVVDLECSTLAESKLLTDTERNGIYRGNALKLLPKFCEPEENGSLPVFKGRSMLQVLHRAKSKLRVKLVGALQNQ